MRQIKITGINKEGFYNVQFWQKTGGELEKFAELFIERYMLLDTIDEWINEGTINGK